MGVTNLTPHAVSIPYKDDILTLELHKLDRPSERPYTGPYQKKLGLGAEDLEVIAEGDGMAFSEVLTTLRSLSSNVAGLTNQVRMMQWILPVGLGIIAIITAIK